MEMEGVNTSLPTEITVNIATDLWGRKVNLTFRIPHYKIPLRQIKDERQEIYERSSSWQRRTRPSLSPPSPNRQRPGKDSSSASCRIPSLARALTWASFVDGVETVFYAEAISRRPLVVEKKQRAGDGGGSFRNNEEEQEPIRSRMHVCDVPTFVAESFWLLVHTCGAPARWEALSSLDQLYDMCQLFLFQPPSSVIGTDSVAVVGKPCGRRDLALSYVCDRYGLARPPLSLFSILGGEGKGTNRGGEKSSILTKGNEGRELSYFPDAQPPPPPPLFETASDAATACFLVLLRAQLRATGVTDMLVREVLESFLLGFSSAAVDIASCNGTSAAVMSYGTPRYSQKEPAVALHQRHFQTLVPILFADQVNGVYSANGGHAGGMSDRWKRGRDGMRSLSPKPCAPIPLDVVARSLRGIEAVSYSLGGESNYHSNGEQSKSDDSSFHNSERYSPQRGRHRYCSSSLCEAPRFAEIDSASERGRSQTSSKQYIRLEDWLTLCAEMPDLLWCGTEKLFALPTCFCEALPLLAEYGAVTAEWSQHREMKRENHYPSSGLNRNTNYAAGPDRRAEMLQVFPQLEIGEHYVSGIRFIDSSCRMLASSHVYHDNTDEEISVSRQPLRRGLLGGKEEGDAVLLDLLGVTMPFAINQWFERVNRELGGGSKQTMLWVAEDIRQRVSEHMADRDYMFGQRNEILSEICYEDSEGEHDAGVDDAADNDTRRARDTAGGNASKLRVANKKFQPRNNSTFTIDEQAPPTPRRFAGQNHREGYSPTAQTDRNRPRFNNYTGLAGATISTPQR